MVAVALAAPNDGSARAGEDVARQGGNAVDVAIAAMFAALVSEPGMSSLGGGGFVTIAAPGQDPVTVDGSVAMPGLGRSPSAPVAALTPLHLEYSGGTDMLHGPASVAVPGTLSALELSHQRFGRVAWRPVVTPAAQLARDGFVMGSAAAHYLSFSGGPLFGLDPSAAAVLTGPGGVALGLGDRMRMPELAAFLEQLADEGAAALMAGDVAERLVALMQERGGLLTARDLAEYRAIVRPALAVSRAGWDFGTNPAPAVGGPVLAAMLTLLLPASPGRAQSAVEAGLLDEGRASEGPRAGGAGATTGDGRASAAGPVRPVRVSELIDVQRAVLSYRATELDVAPDRVAAAETLLATAAAGGLRGTRAPSTVHVSAVDTDGYACAITASAGYGSGLSAPGTGVWLNSCLGEPELNRGRVAPGERLVSNMAPTVARHLDGRVLAIGSPGADRITTALLQTVLGLAQGDSLADAVRRPRVHVGIDDAGNVTRVETEADVPDRTGVAADLPWREHEPLSMFFGGVGAALRAADGSLTAVADPRRAGAVVIT